MRRVFSELNRLTEAVWTRPNHPEDEAAFWAQRARDGARNWTSTTVLALAAILLWWPTDLVTFRGEPEVLRVFAWTRGWGVVLTASALLGAWWSPWLRAHSEPFVLAVACAVVFVAGWQFSVLGPPRELWFQWLNPIVFAPIALSLKPWRRVRYGVLPAFAMVAGYFGRTPSHLQAPLALAVLSWLVFLTVTGIGAGLLADGMRRRSFFLQCEMRRQSEALRVLSSELDERVRRRTAEVERLSRHLESTREDERARLARELHDELGQELTALRYAVELAQERHGVDPAGTRRNLEEISALLSRTHLATRELVTSLRPRVLDDLGLVSAVEWLARRTAERTGLAVEVRVPPQEPPLGAGAATAAYRVLQEALTNVAKHARATRVAVSIEVGREAVALAVADDGVGFDHAADQTGFGLLGMRERVRGAGGEFALEGGTGRGTTVRVRFPVEARRGDV